MLWFLLKLKWMKISKIIENLNICKFIPILSSIWLKNEKSLKWCTILSDWFIRSFINLSKWKRDAFWVDSSRSGLIFFSKDRYIISKKMKSMNMMHYSKLFYTTIWNECQQNLAFVWVICSKMIFYRFSSILSILMFRSTFINVIVLHKNSPIWNVENCLLVCEVLKS